MLTFCALQHRCRRVRVVRRAIGAVEIMSSVALPPLPADLEYCVVARAERFAWGGGSAGRCSARSPRSASGWRLAFAAAARGRCCRIRCWRSACSRCAFAWCRAACGGLGAARRRRRPRGRRAGGGTQAGAARIQPVLVARRSARPADSAGRRGWCLRGGGARGCSATRCRRPSGSRSRASCAG